MKITDLELEQYGIYQNESWKPAAGCLNVIMGENESGKTTLLRFIRDMMFGYERGKWQGKKGNMGFLRADGSAYRIYRDGKNKWAVNDKGEEFNDELSSLWWHGLNRGIYEKIFAVGLEDLQGTSFLADDSVRSRFFMLQGGDLKFLWLQIRKWISSWKNVSARGSIINGQGKLNVSCSSVNRLNYFLPMEKNSGGIWSAG